MKQSPHTALAIVGLLLKQLLNAALIIVGLWLLAGGYHIWFTRHESDWPRANMSFVYLIPGWALTVMGYIGWKIDGWIRFPAAIEKQPRIQSSGA